MNPTAGQPTDPDVYASDLHRSILVDGRRSSKVRMMWRLAQNEPGAELERIFETMVAESKRAEREARTPSIWNLPTRSFEWLFEHARFMPPREVITTLFYVGVLIFGVEFAKGRYYASQTDELLSNTLFTSSISDSLDGSEGAVGFTQDSDVTNRVDKWFSDEVADAMDRVLESERFSAKLRSAVVEAINREAAVAAVEATALTKRSETVSFDDLAPAKRIEKLESSSKVQDLTPTAVSENPAITASVDNAVSAASETFTAKIEPK